MGPEHDRALIYETRKQLGDILSIKKGVKLIKQPFNSAILGTMLGTFEEVLEEMNSSSINPDVYQKLADFRLNIRSRDDPLTLEQAIGRYNDALRETEKGDPIAEIVDHTFADIRQIIVNGTWPFVTEETADHPLLLATGLMIEGWGVFLEHTLQSGIARKFVLAFEEVLILNHPKSRLLDYTIGWMRDDIEEFSPTVSDLIRAFQPNYSY